MGNNLIELFERRKKEYSKANEVIVSLTFSQKLENKIEQLKLASLSKKEKEVECENVKIRTSISSLYFEDIKKSLSSTINEFEKEIERVFYKQIFIEKKDKEFRKEQLREIRGKGFNSQKIEILLELLLKEKIDQLFYFHDLFEQLYKQFITNFNFAQGTLNAYFNEYLIIYKLSTEPYRVLLN